MTARSAHKKALTFASILAIAASTAAGAHDRHEPRPEIDPYSVDFRAGHPMRVFIDVDTPQEKHERDLTAFEKRTLKNVREALPGYIEIVDDRRAADLVIGARETGYQLSFRITDRDRKDKKYKGRNKFTGGRCGYMEKAYYTKVKEKGEAIASYELTLRARGERRREAEHDRIVVRPSESFSYGVDLMARTSCGLVPTSHYPNRDVAELFAQGSPDYRRQVAREVRREAAEDLGHALAARVRGEADQFYSGLATYLDRRYGDAHGHDRWLSENHDWNSREDATYGWSFEYSRPSSPLPASGDAHVPDRSDGDLGAAVLVATGLAILAASVSGN